MSMEGRFCADERSVLIQGSLTTDRLTFRMPNGYCLTPLKWLGTVISQLGVRAP